MVISTFVVEESLVTSDTESNKNASKQNGIVHLGTFQIRTAEKNNLWADKPPQKKNTASNSFILIIMGNMNPWNLTLTNVVLAH